MKLTIIGTGYVGLVTGTCFSEMGNKVYCVDIDEEKIKNLKKGILPIYEPHLKTMVINNQKKGSLIFTTNLKEALDDSIICFIAVGTPMAKDGSADLSQVLNVASNIGENLLKNILIVVKSTVPIGTCDKIKNLIESKILSRNIDVKISIAANPEFLKEGVAVEDCMHPDRIVIGAEENEVFDIMKELYNPFVLNHDRYVFMDTKSAEMTKYAANAMLATRISFMNEMANICEKTGANIKKVRLGIGSDKRIGYDFLYAGCGYGGSCFPKDVQALINTSKKYNYSPKLLSTVELINNEQKNFLVNKIINKFGSDLSNLTFALWGLSFKPETDDIREAPSLTIINKLTKLGAKIKAYDSQALEASIEYFSKNNNVSFFNNKYDVLKDADALILVTEWKEFRNLDLDILSKNLKNKIIFDGRNVYDKKIVKKAGFELYQIGC